MKKIKPYRMSRECVTEVQTDIPLAKLLLGLTHLPGCVSLPEKKVVMVNMNKVGVERPSRLNGCSEIILWTQLEDQNPLNSQISKLFYKPLSGQSDVGFKKINSFYIKFTIFKTYFSIGIDTELLHNRNFFRDVLNIITYRGAKVRLHTMLIPILPVSTLGILPSGHHDYMIVPMNPVISEFTDFVRSLWVIVLKESSSSDLTTRSSSDFSNVEDMSVWKVWNWRNNGFCPNYDAFNDDDFELYQNDTYYEMQNADTLLDDDTMPYDAEMDGPGDMFMNNMRSPCIYPKEFIIALKDHPLSRKKPENIEHINIMVKSYNGYQVSQPADPDGEVETRTYSKKFLLSLRYVPLSMRRPDCPEHSSVHNLRTQCFKQARDAAAYRHYDKESLSQGWFPSFSSRRDYDRLHCSMHYKRY